MFIINEVSHYYDACLCREQSEKESDKNKDLGEELADVVFVVLCLANQTGIDLQAAFDKKLDLKTNRDHDRHHNNEKLK